MLKKHDRNGLKNLSSLLICLLPCIFIGLASALIYDRCELAVELYYDYKIPARRVAYLVCMAFVQSRYNTSLINYTPYGTMHGIFQIYDVWCTSRKRKYRCPLTCSKLVDEYILDDVECLEKVWRETEKKQSKINAWRMYNHHCKPHKAAPYIKDCL